MNLDQGAISSALLRAAGPSLQAAILRKAQVDRLDPGSLVVTDGFNLSCQKVFHTVCPSWTPSGPAQKVTGSSHHLDVSWFFCWSHLGTFCPRL